MLEGLISVAVIFLIFSVGFLFSARKIWPENATASLSVIVIKIAAPCLAVVGLADDMPPALLKSALLLIVISFLHVGMLYAAGKGLSRLLRLDAGRRAIFEVTFTLNNVIFIGLPINQIAFGPSGLPFLFTYYIVSLLVCWSVGVYEIARVSQTHANGISWKTLLSPGLIGVFAGTFLGAFQLAIPGVIHMVLQYLAGLCVPLSLLVIGANLTTFTKSFSPPSKDEIVSMAGKFLISPLFMLLLLTVFGVNGLPFRVLMLSSSMPCHMQTSILAHYYDVESEYAARLVSLSSVLCLITIPVFVTLLR
jgi:predicted permease